MCKYLINIIKNLFKFNSDNIDNIDKEDYFNEIIFQSNI